MHIPVHLHYTIRAISQRHLRRSSTGVMSYRTSLSKISDVEYDQHLATTSGTRFHADPINLGIVMVQVTTRKSSKILRCWLDGSRDSTTKWIVKSGLKRDRCHWMNMPEKDMFLIL